VNDDRLEAVALAVGRRVRCARRRQEGRRRRDPRDDAIAERIQQRAVWPFLFFGVKILEIERKRHSGAARRFGRGRQCAGGAAVEKIGRLLESSAHQFRVHAGIRMHAQLEGNSSGA